MLAAGEVANLRREVEVLDPADRARDGRTPSPRSRLRLVEQFGAGLDGVDVDAAAGYGVSCCDELALAARRATLTPSPSWQPC